MAKVTLDMVKCDCIILDTEKVECKGLTTLQCINGGKCPFYKSNKEYHIDGTKRKYPIC